jgi:hypothetical protein
MCGIAVQCVVVSSKVAEEDKETGSALEAVTKFTHTGRLCRDVRFSWVASVFELVHGRSQSGKRGGTPTSLL